MRRSAHRYLTGPCVKHSECQEWPDTMGMACKGVGGEMKNRPGTPLRERIGVLQ